jgi:hypothetical protein
MQGFSCRFYPLLYYNIQFHPPHGRLTTLQYHEVMNTAGSQSINTTLTCATCSQSYQLLRTSYLLQRMNWIKGKILSHVGWYAWRIRGSRPGALQLHLVTITY